MKTLGMIGGVGPESTIEYYRAIFATHRERTRDGSAPSLLISSIDVTEVLRLVAEIPFLDTMRIHVRAAVDRLMD